MKKRTKFVAYLRVSTREQGQSGLGIEAQREEIKREVEKQGGEIEVEIIEVESGKRDKRPKLAQAIRLCTEKGYTLIVAKLDRLGRNAGYLFQIRDKIKSLVICDHLNMTTLEFGIYATMAQEERERISMRTKAALQARERLTGQKNGNKKGCNLKTAIQESARVRRRIAMEQDYNEVARKIIVHKDCQGLSLRAIAKKLNEYGIKTATGKQWTACTVSKVIKMYGIKQEE